MKVVLIGATGQVGRPVLDEALSRGHDVTAVVRKPERLPAHPRLRAAGTDVYDEDSVTAVVRGSDAVVSAFSPGLADPDLRARHVRGARTILRGIERTEVARLLVVGGAGCLAVKNGLALVDSQGFPAEWKETALATRDVLEILQKEARLDWVFVCPPMHLESGARTGRYRLGADEIFFDADGKSHLSYADYAVAMVDELERAAHHRQRIAAAY